MAVLNRTLQQQTTRRVETASKNGWEININYDFIEGQKPVRIEVSGQKPGTPSAYFSANHSVQDNSFSIAYGGIEPDDTLNSAVFDTLKAIVQEFEPIEE